ncbi:tyrosine-type recombinase/integrase [Mycobacteroides abscessus subsp. abscessus]|uniref:tyrosine-type recombinase/integrase n=1 Tax=Mycobacteroides abscessus TaxID=36809 RepID=UPI0009408703|nr:tyrosine-type recombinase/integrase [Mycobacteroides abscessus]MDO3092013.1 tyrosine-type recombinase/integrase [Mycobacteroides abscessus subsp. abscessus]
MYRAFRFCTDAGAYWSVVQDSDYSVIEVADRCLQFLRFGRGLAESTTRKYAEAIALYYRFCEERSVGWADPDMTAFQMWLRIAPSPRHPHPDRQAWAGPGRPAARSNGRLNLITYAVCEMFKYAAAEGYWAPSKLGLLFETAPARSWTAWRDRRSGAAAAVIIRRRHQLRPKRNERRDAPIDTVKAAVGACGNLRDAFLIVTLATTGLRRGEVLGLRLSDIHFLPSSTALGCQFEGAHLHVRPRENSNGARVKREKPRVVPVASTLVPLYDQYRHERDSCRAARSSDYVFVNLYRHPLGEPMKLHAVNELFIRLSNHVGQKITPHMLRHTFGTSAAREATLDVVAELLGHSTIRSTEVYLHPDMTLQRRAIEDGSLSRLLDPKVT